MSIRNVSRSVMVTLIAAAAAACNGNDGQRAGNTMAGEEDAAVPTDTTSPTDASTTVDVTDELDASTDTTTPVDGGVDSMAVDHGGACVDPIALHSGTVIHAASTPTTGIASTACRPSDAPQRFFSLDIPAGERATITIDPTDWIAVGRVLLTCDATMCITDGQSDVAGAPVTLVVDNPGTDVLHKIVTVSGLSSGHGGTFDIVATLGPVGTDGGMPGDGGDGGTTGRTCSLDTERALVGPSDTFTGSFPPDGVGHQLTGACISSAGTDRIFPFHLDRTSMVELSVNQSNGGYQSAGLSIRTACEVDAPQNGCDRNYDMFGSALLRLNLAPGDYYAILDWNGSSRASTYTLNFHTYPSVENSSCGFATTVIDGSVRHGEHGASGGQNEEDCLGVYSRPPQPILWYSATVPAGQTLTATATPTAGSVGSSYVSLMNDCLPTVCLSDGARGPSGTQSYTNTGSSPMIVMIAVVGTADFDLAVSIR